MQSQNLTMQSPYAMQAPCAMQGDGASAQSKSLRAIQVLAKIGKVMSRVVFICSIVGMAVCVMGVLSYNLIPDGIKVNGVTIHSMIESNANWSMGAAYAAAFTGFILCAAECAISKLSELYFKHELAAGTPFTVEGANEMLRLGICTISISLGAVIVAALCDAIAMSRFAYAAELQVGDFSQVGIGIGFIILSVVFRYGSELLAEKRMAHGA